MQPGNSNAAWTAPAGPMEEHKDYVVELLQQIQGNTEYAAGKSGYDEERTCWWANVPAMLERQLKVQENQFEGHLTIMKWQMKREKQGLKDMWLQEKYDRPGKNFQCFKDAGVPLEVVEECFDEARKRAWVCFYAESAVINKQKQFELYEKAVYMLQVQQHPMLADMQKKKDKAYESMQEAQMLMKINDMEAQKMKTAWVEEKWQDAKFPEQVRSILMEAYFNLVSLGKTSVLGSIV